MDEKLHITRYEEIPDIPLLLDQVLLLANQALAKLTPTADDGEKPACQLTSSMVNNYVKTKLVPAPVKKRYGREQVCRLIWICLLKQVMDLKDVETFFAAAEGSVPFEQAYDGFCNDVEALLGAKQAPQLPLDELVLTAAQAVAARVRLLELVAQMRPALEDGTPNKPARKKQRHSGKQDKRKTSAGSTSKKTAVTPEDEGAQA